MLLFLFGLYDKVAPKAAEMTLTKVQGWLHIAGSILFPIGIALAISVSHALQLVTPLGSLVVLTAMIPFVIIVLRSSRT
jgi:uncharacterized membrane protein YgdD (TMEM256/DUF423 family)